MLVLPSPLIEKEIDKGESYVLGHLFDIVFLVGIHLFDTTSL